MFTFWSSKVQDGRTYPLNTAYIVALILRRFLSHNYVKHTTHIEILCTLTGFLYVFYFFFIYILWCGGILIKDILFLYTFRSPITTHYLSLVDRAPTPHPV